MRRHPSNMLYSFLSSQWIRPLVLIVAFLVTRNYAKDALRAPRFLSEPTGSESVVNEGHTKILQCQVIGHPQPQYRWLKDWEPLGPFGNEHFLKMVNVSLHDAGEYRCLAKNSVGTVLSPRIVLKVAYMSVEKPDHENTTVEIETVRVNEGDPLVIPLPQINSYPPPSVTWHSDDSEHLYDIHYVIMNPDNALVILDAEQKYSQTYSARITNTQLGIEMVTSGTTVVVEGENPTEEVAPSFVVTPSNVTILKGTNLSQLQCIVNARPLYQLETLWFKGEDPIERAGIKYFPNGPWNRTLSLLDVNPTHEGTYRCQVRLKSSLDEPLIGTMHVTVQAPPFLKKLLPEETEADLAKGLSLSCLATGSPVPEIRWFRNGIDVLELSDPRYSVHPDGTFSISSISLTDTGTLQCLAANPIGEMSTYTWLRVKRKRNPRESPGEGGVRVVRGGLRGLRPKISTNPFSTAPVMSKMPTNLTAVDGQAAVRIPCRATGAPKPNVTWYFDDEILQSGPGIEVEAEGDLVLKSVREEHAGKYICVRENEAGQAEGEAWLQVLVKTRITVPPVDTSVVLGHVATFQCKVSSAPSMKVEFSWYHDGLQVDSMAPQTTILKDGTLIIEQVRATDAGTYTCEATSPGGNDTRAAVLKVMDLPYPPKLIVAEREESVPKSATISWTKNFDGHSPITKFIVFKREVPPNGIETDLGLNWEVALSNVSASANSALVTDLRPSTAYQFKVAAVNNVGEGPPSEPSDILVLPQEAPSGPPQGLVGSPRSNSEIMIQWEPPLEQDTNGVLMGYIVRYRLWGYKDSQWYYNNITKETQHNYLITGLITWKDYEIQVAAYNVKGVGVYSSGIRVKTKEGIPLAPPRDVRVEVKSSTSITVYWRPPQPWMINGINQGYKVQAWDDHPANATASPVTVKVAPSPYPDAEEKANITGLSKFSQYFITVLCFTHPGDGKRSQPIMIKTFEDVPDQITNLKFDDISDRHVTVMWSPPDNQNGILKGYTLSYYKKNSDDYVNTPTTYNLTADVTTISIDNLTATTFYTFEVYAWTAVGPGKPVSATIQSSVEPVQPDPPTRLAVSNIQPFSVVLQFTPGFDGNASIDLWIVQAQSSRSSTWEVVSEISAPLASTLTVENLVPFTKYSLRLVAVNVAGESIPSIPSPSFQTLQAAPAHSPSNMTVRAMSPSEIRVRWVPLQQHEWYGVPRGYKIKYRAEGCNCAFTSNFVSDVTANSYQLEQLQEFTAYEVKMAAVNDIGSSEDTTVAVERTRESVPSAGPSNVSATATSSTTIVVEWGTVPLLEQNGILEGYKVVYAGRNLKPEGKVIENNATFATTLTHLKKFYMYTIQVRAFTRLGDGVLSTPLLVQTLEDVPGPPSDVSFPDVSFTYARIIWDEPQEPNGVITAYDVTYHLTDDQYHNHTIEFGPNGRTYRAEEMKPESNYLFLVRARTRLGWGVALKAPVYTTNNRELPAPPSRPRISTSQTTSSSILFTWSPGKDGFAPIRYYSVQYSEDGGDWFDISERIDFSATSHTVSGLKPFTPYKFRIQATNDIGASGWSEESQSGRTKPAAPMHAPRNIKVIPITRSSVRVEWSPLSLDAWSGDPDTGGYRVKYRQITDILTPFNTQSKELSNLAAQNVVLNDLQRDTNYEIIVTSFNLQGESPPSSPHTIYVGEAVPTGTPRNLKATPLSPTEIKIQWEPPAEKERNGELLGYKIFYRRSKPYLASNSKMGSNSPLMEEVEVVGPKTNSFELLYLDMYTEYIVTLLCFNPAGEGPRSSPVLVRTKQSLPGPVVNLTFSDITMNSLKVMWNPPLKPNGKILGYLVTYETAKPDENFSKQVKQKVTTTYLLVQSLNEEVTYKFIVKAETIGYGPKVEANVTTGPQPGSPARPKDVRLSQTVSSVTLHWRNSHPGNAPLLGYYIEAKKKAPKEWQRYGNSWTVLMKSETGMQEEYTVSFQNLLPSTTYTFRLTAYNKYGISYPSVADQEIVTPTKVFMEYGYLQQQPFYHKTWFMVSLAAISVVIIIIVIAALCVKSKTYKYKQEAANKTLEESVATDDTAFSYEMTQRGAISKRGTLNRSTLGRRSVSGAAAIVSAKSPPRPAPASVTYSDDDTVKGYDENPDDNDSSDVTEKPTDISSTDSQDSESGVDDNDDDTGAAGSRLEAPNSSFVSHYANVNDALRQSWRRQKPFKNYSTYTDSEAEGSAVMSLNGGHIIMNNMAGSRAPLPGFSSFV